MYLKWKVQTHDYLLLVTCYLSIVPPELILQITIHAKLHYAAIGITSVHPETPPLRKRFGMRVLDEQRNLLKNKPYDYAA